MCWGSQRNAHRAHMWQPLLSAGGTEWVPPLATIVSHCPLLLTPPSQMRTYLLHWKQSNQGPSEVIRHTLPIDYDERPEVRRYGLPW